MSKFNNPDGAPYYCVIGHPIEHSLSPRIHSLFAKNLDIELLYERVEVPPDQLLTDLRTFAEMGGRGMNVTVPHKEAVIKHASELRPRADLAGAANTLTFGVNGDYVADNTDGIGLVHDLTNNHAVQLAGKNILILGAGGAVRGVLAPLIEQAPGSVTIVNRTLDKARALIERFSNIATYNQVTLRASSYSDLPQQSFNVVVNGTSLGLSGRLPPVDKAVVNEDTFVYDMVYDRSGITDFTQWGIAAGARLAADGLGMLVEQAAEAFFLWHGIRPETSKVLDELRMKH